MLKPVNKSIFVTPDRPPEKRGNIFMPPSDVRVCSGIVQASDSKLCKPGDLITYSRFWPTTVRGLDVVVVGDEDLVGVDPEPAPYNVADEPVSAEESKGLLEAPPAPRIALPNRRIIH